MSEDNEIHPGIIRLLPSAPPEIRAAINKIRVANILRFLTPREEFAIIHYYGLNGCKPITYSQIAEKLGITEQGVFALIRKIRFVIFYSAL